MSTPTTTHGRELSDADAERLAAEFDEERPGRRLSHRVDLAVNLWCFLVALFVLKQVFFPLTQGSQYYLVIFLAVTLPLAFVCYRFRASQHDPVEMLNATERNDNPGLVDWALAALTLVVGLYPILPIPESSIGFGGYEGFLDRQGSLLTLDVIAGMLLMVLVLEATRRTTGLVLPVVCVIFFAYAYYGGYLPIGWEISHIGLSVEQIVNALYNEASGFFGVPLDVAATYIVLFTIYGAVLERMGAGRFFVEFSFSLFRKSATAPGRTVATSGFLLGTVSGSGTATAVTLGSFAWPILKRAGYPKESAGGMLAASGIGAILSPPTMGAAAFIIAEYLSVSYISVLGWAIVPTLLYYLGIFIAVEIDARRFGAKRVELAIGSPWSLLARSGYHFISLGVIVFFLAIDVPPFKAVVYATLIAALFGLLEALIARQTVVTGFDDEDGDAERLSLHDSLRHYASRLYGALAAGIRSGLPGDRGVRRGRHHHLHHRQDRARPDPRRLARQGGRGAGPQPGHPGRADRPLRGDRDPHPRPRRAGHRVVHPQLGHHRPGPDPARRRCTRDRDVHLLLRGALGGVATDGAGGRRLGGDHRRQGDPDDVAGLQVHAAGLPRAARLRDHRQRLAAPRAGQHRRGRRRHPGLRPGRVRPRGRHHRLDVRSHPAPGAPARPRGGAAPALPRAALDGHRRRRPRGGGRPAPAHPQEERHAHRLHPGGSTPTESAVTP